MLIGIISILSFGGIFSSIVEWKYESQESKNDYLEPPYVFTDPLEHPDLTLLEQTEATYFKNSEQVEVMECNSLNSMYDFSDNFVFKNGPDETREDYHVMIQSTHELDLYSVSMYDETPDWLLNIDYKDFNTSEIQSINGDGWRFQVKVPNVDSSLEYENLSYAKYHVAYIAVSSNSSINTTAVLSDAIDAAGTPSKCGTFSLFGSLESRVRATSIGFLFSGTFLIGCCIHRFYIVSGNHGVTSQTTMTRTFMLGQGVSVILAGVLILLFDPLDGKGITGVSTEQLIETGILVAKFTAAVCGLLAVSALSIVLYRQRNLIGEMIEVERTRADVDEWFD